MTPPPPTTTTTTTTLTLCFVAGFLVAPLRPAAGTSGVNSRPAKETFLDYYMLEELPPRSLVGNLVRDYGLDHHYRPAVLASLRYDIMSLCY